MIKITNEQDWHKHRAKGIGGSDAACILGLNPWKSNVDLWKEKTGRKKPDDISNEEAVIYGKKAEEYIRGLFELDYQDKYCFFYEPYDLQQNKDYPFIIGTLDEVLRTTEAKFQTGFAEFKTTEIRKSTDWDKWNNRIPDNYYCQVLHYFLTNENFKFAKLRALIKSTNKDGETIRTIKDYHFDRADLKEDLEKLLEAEIKFWWHVEHDKEPSLILPSI